MFESIESTREALAGRSYFADAGLGTSLFLAIRMEKALFLEGEPGVGKTEVARVALLIDESDRADEEFESFLLELLADFQITIPELGTLRAEHRPLTLGAKG